MRRTVSLLLEYMPSAASRRAQEEANRTRASSAPLTPVESEDRA